MPKRKTFREDEVESMVRNAIPQAENYGQYTSRPDFHGTGVSKNYGAHTMKFEFLGIYFWFSYETLVAFKFPGEQAVIVDNYWNRSTGKHLGWIRQDIRGGYIDPVTYNEFHVRYVAGLRKMGLSKLPELCVLQEKPKAPKRKPVPVVALRKKGEPLVAEPPPPPPKPSEFYSYPRKQTRKQKAAWEAGIDIQQIDEEVGLDSVDGMLV